MADRAESLGLTSSLVAERGPHKVHFEVKVKKKKEKKNNPPRKKRKEKGSLGVWFKVLDCEFI